jgi:transcriptional regulator with XRE-family HTH domain
MGKYSYFGIWLIESLKKEGMSRAQLSEELGISVPRITQFVLGQGAPSIPTLVRMCEILKIDDYKEPLLAIYQDDTKKAFKKAA